MSFLIKSLLLEKNYYYYYYYYYYCCYYHYCHHVLAVVIVVSFSVRESHNKWPKANRIISSSHFQHFPQYPCSSQQGSFLHYSNIHLSNPLVTLPWAPISLSRSYLYGYDFYHFEFLQSFDLSLQILVFSHSFPFFFPYSYISWYSNVDDRLSPFALNCQLQICLVNLPLRHCHTEHWYPTKLWLSLYYYHYYCHYYLLKGKVACKEEVDPNMATNCKISRLGCRLVN